MSIFTGTPSTNASSGFPYATDDSTPQASLGQVIFGDDNRKFIYAKAGASALVAGSLYQSAAEDTSDQNIAATATAVGSFTLTTAAMTVTKNQYQGGYVGVTVTPGLATYYRIASHDAYTAAAATFTLEDPIQVALTTTTRLDFIPNPYNGVVIAPTTASSSLAGVAVNDVTAGNYGWLQIAGPCPCLNDAAGALTVGVAVMRSSSVAGAVRLQTAGNQIVGEAMTGIAASEVGFVNLRLG